MFSFLGQPQVIPPKRYYYSSTKESNKLNMYPSGKGKPKGERK